MAEPIRTFTPRRDVREELRRKVENAPIDHAEALLAAYELLQEAQDHGVLDTLRGAIGAGEAFISKASQYANTPEGIRLMRNLLAMARLLGELDPAVLSAAGKAMSSTRDNLKKNSPSPSLLHSLQRLMGTESRRAFATVTEFLQSFGTALNGGQSGTDDRNTRLANGVAVPTIASTAVVVMVSFWLSRRRSSRHRSTH